MNQKPNNSASSPPPRETRFGLNDITGAIVDAAFKMHIELRSGLLESVYEAVLVGALEKRGAQVEWQKVIEVSNEP